MNKQHIRRTQRALRQALTPHFEQAYASQCLKRVMQSGLLLSAQRIGLYITNDGELDTYPLIKQGWRLNKKIYLPFLHPIKRNLLGFAPYFKHSRCKINQYGIPEPYPLKPIPLTALDLVFAPLVAFTTSGERLGMGGGYYDRTFNRLFSLPYRTRPRVIGLAYDFQRVDQLPTEPWDIPLDGVITEKHIYWFN